MAVGAADARAAAQAANAQKYDLLFEDQIEYVKASGIAVLALLKLLVLYS